MTTPDGLVATASRQAATQWLDLHHSVGRSLQARHAGEGRYGRATGRAVEVLGISHAELEGGRIVREWHLIDDVAIWMQLLDPRS